MLALDLLRYMKQLLRHILVPKEKSELKVFTYNDLLNYFPFKSIGISFKKVEYIKNVYNYFSSNRIFKFLFF